MPYKNLYKLSATTIGYLLRIGSFVAVVFGFYVLYRLLLDQLFDRSQIVWPLFGLWILSAYFVIPRIHRILTKYYLPDYYVGRIRSPSGFLSDPINIAFFGNASSIHAAMKKAGWQKADPLTPKTLIKVIYCSVFRKSYPNAPVGDMFLFSRKFNFAYQQEVNGSPNERHHIRFWKTPANWHLPGGHSADWLGAATYDTHVGVKIASGQIDHFIHEDIDTERDYIVSSLKKTGLVKNVEIIEHFTDAYHSRSNGGDRIRTDGALPFIKL